MRVAEFEIGAIPEPPERSRPDNACMDLSINRPFSRRWSTSQLPRVLQAHERPRLRATRVRIADVTEETLEAAWKVFANAYAGADRARFERDWRQKQHVILLRDVRTGVLQGFSTIAIRHLRDRAQPNGVAATVVFSGDTVIDPAYWGTKALQRSFSALLVRLRLGRPTTPLYWFLISKGYKTYLMLVRACPRAIPRSDRADDAHLQQVLDTVAKDRFGPAYDPATGIVRHRDTHESVRSGLCPVDDVVRTDPHVAFFVARNPGHAHGDELACLAHIRLRDPLRQILRAMSRRWARRRPGDPRAGGDRQ